ncbi:hypothetical protein D3C78_1058630 [compost metagenome]
MQQHNDKSKQLKPDRIPSFRINCCLGTKFNGCCHSPVNRVIKVGCLHQQLDFSLIFYCVRGCEGCRFRLVLARLLSKYT